MQATKHAAGGASTFTLPKLAAAHAEFLKKVGSATLTQTEAQDKILRHTEHTCTRRCGGSAGPTRVERGEARVMTIEEAGEFIADQAWTYAKTMPQWPHEYIIKYKRPDQARRFEAFARLILTEGELIPWPESSKNPRYRNIYLVIDGFKYWSMGPSGGQDRGARDDAKTATASTALLIRTRNPCRHTSRMSSSWRLARHRRPNLLGRANPIRTPRTAGDVEARGDSGEPFASRIGSAIRRMECIQISIKLTAVSLIADGKRSPVGFP